MLGGQPLERKNTRSVHGTPASYALHLPVPHQLVPGGGQLGLGQLDAALLKYPAVIAGGIGRGALDTTDYVNTTDSVRPDPFKSKNLRTSEDIKM